MIKTYHREKLINAIIYFVKTTKYCGKTKLLKLLYFIDFMHFRQTAKSVTGLDYHAWEMGPVPPGLFKELSGNPKPDLKKAIKLIRQEKFQKIVATADYNDEYFTNREKKLMEQISFIFRDTKSEDIIEISHLENAPWNTTKERNGLFQKIDYMLAINEKKDSLTKEEAEERLKERSEIYEIFGVI